MTDKFRKIENLHILLWLVKDIGWVRHYAVLGMIMIVPTLFVALWLTWKMRDDFSELTHNVAVCCWISANSIWMTGEFFYEDKTRDFATVFFMIGLLALGIHYGKEALSYCRRPKAIT